MLGITACVFGTLVPTPTRAQSCDQILTYDLAPGEQPAVSLWIGERILSGTADATCGGESALGTRWWEKKVTRIAAGCEPVAAAKDQPSSRPEVTSLNMAALDTSNVISVGEVTSTEPGIYGRNQDAEVYTRVRIRVTEMIRNDSGERAVEDSISFLAPGGSLTTSRGQTFCSEVAPWSRDWKVGDSVLIAGMAGQASDPTFVFSNLIPLQVIDGRAAAPTSWLPNAGSIEIAEVRALAGRRP